MTLGLIDLTTADARYLCYSWASCFMPGGMSCVHSIAVQPGEIYRRLRHYRPPCLSRDGRPYKHWPQSLVQRNHRQRQYIVIAQTYTQFNTANKTCNADNCTEIVIRISAFVVSYCMVVVLLWARWGGPDVIEAWTYLPSVLWHCWLGHLTRKYRPRYDL